MATSKGIVFVIVILSGFITTEACTCIPPEQIPENVGCKNEFMAILDVKGMTSLIQSYMTLNWEFD